MEIRLIPSSVPIVENRADLDEAILAGGRFAGECYSKDGFSALETEPLNDTLKRVDRTLSSGHQTTYEHTNITTELLDIPKALVMLLHGEGQYNTSEKSARYVDLSGNKISSREFGLYTKWTDILKNEITKKFEDKFAARDINKFARENARYFVSVFNPTQLIHTVPLAQINRIYSFGREFIDDYKDAPDGSFQQKMIPIMGDFMTQLKQVNLIDDRFLRNEKGRRFRLLSNQVRDREEYFGDVYSTNYKGSFAQLAHAQRHRVLNFQMDIPNDFSFFTPPILKDKSDLTQEWAQDMQSVSDLFPQGQQVMINERGTIDGFWSKTQERLCTAAQLEINNQVYDTGRKYYSALKEKGHPLAGTMKKYISGPRCTSGYYTCPKPCGRANEDLTRII